MGRKSSKKKIAKAQEVEKIKQKKVKKSSPEKFKGDKRKSNIQKGRIFALLLAIIAVILLVIIGLLIFKKAFRPDPIAKLLPQDKTILSFEINSDLSHKQLNKATELLQDYPELAPEKLFSSFEKKFLLSYENEIKPWIGRQIGVAYLKSDDDRNINKYYFAEILSQSRVKEFLKTKATKFDFKGQEIFLIPSSGQTIAIIEDYLFLSDEQKSIEELINSGELETSLYDSEKYRKINNNMPFSRAAFLYVNFRNITDAFFQKVAPQLIVAKPFLGLFDSEGLAFIALKDKFAVQSFLSLNNEAIKNTQFLETRQKYTADLSKLIGKESLAFWGGENLEYQLKRMAEIISGGDRESMDVFDTILQTYTQRYFGTEISLTRDLLPLFGNEYLLALEGDMENPIYKVIIELGDSPTHAVDVEKVARNFAKIASSFEPKTVEYILPDGTVSKEIVAASEDINFTKESYNGTEIEKIRLGNKDWGVYYATVGNKAIMASQIEGVKNSLDLMNNEAASMKLSEKFTDLIVPLLRNSDEISLFNVEKLLPLLLKDNEMPKYLLPISSLSSGKNYFRDGISSINYINLK